METELADVASETVKISEEVEALAAIDRLESSNKIAQSMINAFRDGEFRSEQALVVAKLIRSEADALRKVSELSSPRHQRAERALSRAEDVILELEFYQ